VFLAVISLVAVAVFSRSSITGAATTSSTVTRADVDEALLKNDGSLVLKGNTVLVGSKPIIVKKCTANVYCSINTANDGEITFRVRAEGATSTGTAAKTSASNERVTISMLIDGKIQTLKVFPQDLTTYPQDKYDWTKDAGCDDDCYTIMNTETTVDVKEVTKTTISTNYVNDLQSGEIPSKITDLDGKVIQTVTVYPSDKPTSKTITDALPTGVRTTFIKEDGTGSYTISVTEQSCKTGNSVCNMFKKTGTAADPDDINYDTLTDVKYDDKYDARLKAYTDSSNALKAYGIDPETIELKADGSAVYKTQNGEFRVSAAGEGQESKVTFYYKGKTEPVQVVSGSWLSGDSYKGGTPSTTCPKTKAVQCLIVGKEELALSKEEYNGLKNTDKISDTTYTLYEEKNGQKTQLQQQYEMNYYRQMENLARGKITQILNAYLDEILGPFSQGVPAAVCGDRMYKKDTTTKKEFGWPLGIPQTTYGSEMERKIWDDLRTVSMVGKVKQLTTTMYRYEVNVKLIGDKKTPTWELYLFNSCTKNSSKSFWSDKGQLGYMQVYVMMYAGQEGEDMIFECGTDPGCKFDQACVKLSDETNPRCFKLAGTIADVCQ
jgi:hypothetical protein